jgi:hypothetical protein
MYKKKMISDNNESSIDPVPIKRKSNNRIRRKITNKPIERRTNDFSASFSLSVIVLIVLDNSIGGEISFYGYYNQIVV